MRKLYYAYVAMDLVPHFEERIAERPNQIEVVSCRPGTSESGKEIACYVLYAEEGIVDPKYEIKQGEATS